MATNPTQPTNDASGQMSVYLPDLNMTKNYPTTMTDDEVDFDTHVNVRQNTPEDYHVNQQPNNVFQTALQGAQSYLQNGQQAMKLLAIRPDVALGLSKDILPEQLAETYKPWGEIWSDTNKAVGKSVMDLAVKNPIAGFMPWFATQYVPEQLLEFGTKPINWVGAYGIEKLGPVILTKALAFMPPQARSFLLKDIFKSETGLADDFNTLGLKPNANTSDVVDAWRAKALETHPDRGGNADDFIAARKAYDNIMGTRQTWLNKILDNFRPGQTPVRKAPSLALSSEAGQADLVPNFEPNDLAKVGSDVVKVIHIAGDVATVNLAGKVTQMAVNKLEPYETKFNPDPLPDELAGAKPRFNIGQASYQPQFQSDIDRAFYITAQKTPSARDADYRAYLQDQGFTDEEIVRNGKLIRTNVKMEAMKNDGGTQDSPAVIGFKPSGLKPMSTVNLAGRAIPTGYKAPEPGAAEAPVSENPNDIKRAKIQKLQKEQGMGYATAKAAVEAGEPAAVSGGGAKPPAEPPPTDLGKIDPENPPDQQAINKEKLAISGEGEKKIDEGVKVLGDHIENQSGVKLTNKQVIEAAKKADILNKTFPREQTLDIVAQQLRTRQHLVAMAENPSEIDHDFLKTLEKASEFGTDAARKLQAQKIEAGASDYAKQKIQVLQELQKLGIEAQKIVDAAKGVDFNDQAQVDKFYRKFVKPSLPEILDEMAYTNILSSPLTHIKNAFSNTLQLLGVNPATKLVSGAIDPIVSAMDKTERNHYVREVPAFYRGVFASHGEAVKAATDVFLGNKTIMRPDVKSIPTLSKWAGATTLGLGKYVTRALEAADIYTQTMVYNGEVESLSARLGHTPNPKELADIKKQAMKNAKYYVYRAELDPNNEEGQGNLLSSVDKLTGLVYQARDWSYNGSNFKPVRWYIRFVKTPMNILKQGIEYSPMGISTLDGAEDKTEQMAKVLIGSIVTAGAYTMAMQGNSTWALPSGKEQRKLFYQSGRVPYSFKVGDRWISYSQVGHLAFPLAMGAAFKYYSDENETALSDGQMMKWMKGAAGMLKFFSDQSYMQGIGDIVNATRGEAGGGSKVAANAPSQLIPLAALQRWVNGIIDPLYRNPAKGFSAEGIADSMKASTVFLSQTLPPQRDLFNKPRENKDRFVNAISPMKTSQSNPQGEKLRQNTLLANQQKSKAKVKVQNQIDKLQKK